MKNLKVSGRGAVKAVFAAILFTLVCSASAEVNTFEKTRVFEASSSLSALDLFNRGIDYESQKLWWNASESFQEAVQKNPNYADAWFHFAKCSYQMNQFDLCVEYIEKCEKLAGEKSEYTNLKALSFISLGKIKEAEDLFNLVLKKYPNNVEARFGLAELELFTGKISGAESLYRDALKRQPMNVKALLSLALVSCELDKMDLARDYINKALQCHSNNEEVYYIASYLSIMSGDYQDAEKKILMACQINGNYDPAYELLGIILYAQKRYQEVIDIADFRINRNRDLIQAWYMKGLALEKLERYEDSLAVWEKGLELDPTDEIMRAAFELSVLQNTSIEDPRRKNWALYHQRKGEEFQKKFLGPEVRYEYQAALKINPKNKKARSAFADILYNDGFNENYLEQIKFVKDNTDIPEPKNPGKETDRDEMRRLNYVRLSDTIDGFESLMDNTLAKQWDINPFYLDKTRWNIGIYYMEKIDPQFHCDIARIAALTLKNMFRGISSTNVRLFPQEITSYADAYKKAYDNHLDYFIIMTGDETERDIKIDAIMYSARTGTKAENFSIYRTGNDRFSFALLMLRKDLLSVLPVKAKILDRKGDVILTDIGKTEGMIKNAVFSVIKKGSVKTSDNGTGIVYTEKDILGSVTLNKVSEEISEGVLSDTGFYDRVNSGDELVLIKMPDAKETSESVSEASKDTAPQAVKDKNAKSEAEAKPNPLKGADLEITRTPSLLKLIRELD